MRDGVVIRSPKQQAATLQINTRTEHIRFRYMHMNPSAMDADGMLNGRRVTEGEQIGVVSNYLDRPNGTSRHLHFDVQVFTRDGWLWVNPYTTLIAAYERLIRGRGREIGTEPVTAAVAHALPTDVLRHDLNEGGAEIPAPTADMGSGARRIGSFRSGYHACHSRLGLLAHNCPSAKPLSRMRPDQSGKQQVIHFRVAMKRLGLFALAVVACVLVAIQLPLIKIDIPGFRPPGSFRLLAFPIYSSL